MLTSHFGAPRSRGAAGLLVGTKEELGTKWKKSSLPEDNILVLSDFEY